MKRAMYSIARSIAITLIRATASCIASRFLASLWRGVIGLFLYNILEYRETRDDG